MLSGLWGVWIWARMQPGLMDTNSCPASSQMMASFRSKSSRITLPMGSSAQRSFGNCLVASMGISPSEYNRRNGLLWQCQARLSQPTVFPAVIVLSRGQGVGRDTRARCQLSTHLHLLQFILLLHCFQLGPQNNQA